jgi:hypothetical protein
MAEPKRSEVIQRELDRLTSEQSAARADLEQLEIARNQHANQMHDWNISDIERISAAEAYRDAVAKLNAQRDFVLTYDDPLAKRRAELDAAIEAEWKQMRLAEIADADRMAEKSEAVWDAEVDESMRVMAAACLRGFRMELEIARKYGVTDALRTFTSVAQNIFERAAIAAGLQYVEARDLGRIAILRIPGAVTYHDQENPPTVNDHMHQAHIEWSEEARRRVDMPPQMRELAKELDTT